MPEQLEDWGIHPDFFLLLQAAQLAWSADSCHVVNIRDSNHTYYFADWTEEAWARSITIRRQSIMFAAFVGCLVIYRKPLIRENCFRETSDAKIMYYEISTWYSDIVLRDYAWQFSFTFPGIEGGQLPPTGYVPACSPLVLSEPLPSSQSGEHLIWAISFLNTCMPHPITALPIL